MIWQNPWAWLGLFTLALPIIIHLLARRSARVQRFPTLRFLQSSRLRPARRTRLADLPLLLVRLAVLAAAVVALAQPLLLTSDRERNLGQRVARVLIVDTSASMQRLTGVGERALDAARREARELAQEAQVSVLIETAFPADQLRGAAEWLGLQPGRRELVVISDFQIGTIEAADLANVPADLGMRFSRIELQPAAQPLELRTRSGEVETTTQTTVDATRTSAAWTVRPAPALTFAVDVLTSADRRAHAEAARSAALRLANVVRSDSVRPIALVDPQYEQYTQVMRAAALPNQPWMGDVAAQLRSEPNLTRVARAQIGGRESLLLFAETDAAGVSAAAILLGALQSVSAATPPAEAELETLPDRVLQQGQRPAAPTTRRRTDGAGQSDGRWLWLLVLVLLGVEAWLRRRQQEVKIAEHAEVRPERVA